MNAKSKKFILNKLIPFIIREHGRGFGMSNWLYKDTPGHISHQDNVKREVPVCGTVACIGGSCQILAKTNVKSLGLSKILGITRDQADGLFYRWEPRDDLNFSTAWPAKFATAFEDAQTPYRKAMVAVRLLKEVIKTNGECLNSKRY